MQGKQKEGGEQNIPSYSCPVRLVSSAVDSGQATGRGLPYATPINLWNSLTEDVIMDTGLGGMKMEGRSISGYEPQ